jgi:type IV pilus assembly protein PilQ
LGRLFRNDSSTENTQNLLIFITARTVSPEGASISDVFDPRRVRGMDLQRADLPGYRDGSDPFAPAGTANQKK